MAWTQEDKDKVIKMYTDAEPTPETSTEIIKDIAEQTGQSANGIRMILVQHNVYVKKDPATAPKKESTKGSSGEGSKRVSKESQIAELTALIENRGKDVDEDILSKLTGKAAAYLVSVFKD